MAPKAQPRLEPAERDLDQVAGDRLERARTKRTRPVALGQGTLSGARHPPPLHASGHRGDGASEKIAGKIGSPFPERFSCTITFVLPVASDRADEPGRHGMPLCVERRARAW